MSNRSVEVKLRFLHESAQALFNSSPSTAAFLEAQYAALAAGTDIDLPKSRRQEICSACGNILIPGWTVQILGDVQRPNNGKKQKQKGTLTHSTKRVVYKCDLCHSETQLGTVERAPKRKGNAKPERSSSEPSAFTQTGMLPIPQKFPGTDSAIDADQTSSSATAPSKAGNGTLTSTSSKKRTKTKKHGSLQAMLAKSKVEASQSPGFGLDLMDFMKNN